MHQASQKTPRTKLTSISLSICTLILVAAFGFSAFGQPGRVAAASGTTNFTVAADTYVNQSSPTTNYGTTTTMRIDGSPVVHSYLRFTVSGLTTGSVTKATLRLFANSTADSGLTVRSVADNTWLETSINYSNAPAMGSVIGTSAVYTANTWVTVDVTSLVKGNGTYSLAVEESSLTANSLATRETGSYAAVLAVDTTASMTPTVPNTHTPTPTQASTNTPVPTSTGDFQPGFPIRATFFYPWFPESWNQQGFNPFTNYNPTAGFYNSGDVATIQKQITSMTYGNINAGIMSWWGQGSPTDGRVATFLGATPGSSNPHFRWSVYYENESTSDPSVTQLKSDISYIAAKYGSNPSFLRVNGKFVMFVYAAGNDACGMADRWMQADQALGHPAYVVLKVFAGYKSCASQPDSWHQYSPAVATDDQAGYSYAISPGFYKKGDVVRLARDLTRWSSNVKSMVASNEPWQLVTTFNEWGEGTSVESANEWQCASGHGLYMDVLHVNGSGNPPQPTATLQATKTATPVLQPTNTLAPTQPAQPTATLPATATTVPTKIPTIAPTATLPSQPTATLKATATTVPTKIPTLAPTATLPGPTPTQPSTCSAAILTKGPTLIFTGNNTQMRVFWQWTANAAFTVQWGTSTSYGSSASVAANDTTNHLYQYDISGLTPGSKYYYRVVTGSQCASGSFNSAPASSASAVKFFSYGDTRTNGSTHNTVAGLVDSAFAADPAYQTLNLNVGDWVSADSESAWTGEYFNPAYTNIRKQDANIADIGVRGNHESGATFWKRYWPEPFQSGGLYWSFDYGPIHVVMLDEYTSYTPGSAQYNWLKADLAGSTKTWKFVVFHEPGWSAGGGHANNTTVQQDLQPLFVQYGVSIAFAGHNHYYARASVGGVTHLTMGGGGAPLYTPASGQPNIVKTYAGNGFGEFNISGNTLTATIVNSSGAVVDTFTITR